MGNKSLPKCVTTNGSKAKNDEILPLSQNNIDPSLKSNESQILKIVKKHNKECQDSKLIGDCLITHFFLKTLEKQARAEIIKEMSQCFVEKGKVLFTQGTPGNYFYIIKEGTVSLTINNIERKKLTTGQQFGELALLYGAPRSGTIKTETDCFFWVMEKKNFKKIVDHIVHISFEDNKKFIQAIPVMNTIDHEHKINLCNNIYKEAYEEGKNIFNAGEIPSCIYFIKDGEVALVEEKTNNTVRVLKKGDYFGERSIFLGTLRTLTATAKTKCTVYSLSTSTLENLLGDNYRSHLYLNILKNAMLKSKSFKNFNVRLFDQVFHLFKAVNYLGKSVVFSEGYQCSKKIVVVVDGALVNSKTNQITSNRCSILFEEDILNNTTRKLDYNLVSGPDCLILEAEMKSITEYFKSSMRDLMDKSSAIERLKKVHLFKNFTGNKLETLSQKIKIDKIPNGKNVITQGEEGSRFFIIKSGKVDIFVNNNYIRTMNENEYLGERALFFKEPRSATAKAQGDVEVFYLEKEDFMTTIEANLKDFLMNRLYLQDNTVQLNELTFYDLLGSGNYGCVSLVKSKKNNYFYAIKNISTKQILYEQLGRNLELERSILLQIDHPFIVKLVKTLKDPGHVYFLMEYIKGKELFDVIRDIGLLTKFQTQFYAASMMLAVEYLHERKFIFRDIKPENIMVLCNGYIKLIDFGTAKAITDKTATIIGTPHYMAPEVILGDGYSFQVDFWSIGICMYEFMCGAVPFGENAEEPMDVYLSIINE